MSQENVEITQRAFKQWQDGGGTLDAIPVEIYAENVEWDLSAYPLVDLPSRGSGRDKLFKTFAQYFAGWKNYQAEAREFIAAGEDVITVLHEKAAIADSDVALERDVFQVWTLRDGVVVKWRVFETREQALEAVGLSEQDAHADSGPARN
jgi:ketosteroid isomerase-like protein